MRVSGRLTAAMTVLALFDAKQVPIRICLSDWGRNNRYAGAGDRAFISGLVKEALRHRPSLAWRMKNDSPRAIIFATLRFTWQWEIEAISAAAKALPHGPGALSDEEKALLAAPRKLGEAPMHVKGNYPEWLAPYFERAFGERAAKEGLALCHRASIDLRVNSLKSTPLKALKGTAPVEAIATNIVSTGLRVPAPSPEDKAPNIEPLPAFAKGFVEIQDLGSQLAALATGASPGQQVLDLCAGGGGKTLALAAMMENTGQLFAHDTNGARLAPLFARLKRAGARNVQVRSPQAGDKLDDLKARMDVVLADAPCSGSGTWRRHPDSKWRLKPEHLAARLSEQCTILDAAIEYVKPGGVLIYVTCSVLREENEGQIEAFLARHPQIIAEDTHARLARRPEIMPAARRSLVRSRVSMGALQLTPAKISTDGFFIATLCKPIN